MASGVTRGGKIKTLVSDDTLEYDNEQEDTLYRESIEMLEKEQETDIVRDIVVSVKKNILKFVEDKNLTICEYLSESEMKRFLQKYI